MIRSAGPADLEALLELRRALWPDLDPAEDRPELEATLHGTPKTVLPLTIFVAEEKGTLFGFIEVGLRSYAEGCDTARPAGYLEGWYVTPERRRRGVGRALVAAAEEWCRGRGCVELGSDTWIDHTDSHLAHAAVGFEEVERLVVFRKDLRR